MNITILNMQLLNFKGVRNLNIGFGNVTNISGDNATGKTSIFDAFTWLLFGKNSEDAKDFNIKTLDSSGQPVHHLEHSVTAILLVDGREMKFKRLLKEKWVKKRGESVAEFTGHETEYYIDDVPLSQKEFQARVDIIMNESIAKMITSPTYFNSLKWQERRGVLEAMAGKINDTEIAGTNVSFRNLLAQLGGDKLDNFKKKIGAKKKLLKDSLETIPTRIDEAERSKPEPVDVPGLQNALSRIEAEIKGIEDAIEDKTKAYELQYAAIRQKQQEKHDLETKLQEAKQASGITKRNKISELEIEIQKTEAEVNTLMRKVEMNNQIIASNRKRIASLTKRNDIIRADWNIENAKTFVMDEHTLNCPACKQALPADEQSNIRERLTTNFNNAKAKALKIISDEGSANKNLIDELTKENNQIEESNSQLNIGTIDKLQRKLTGLKEDVEIVKEWPESDSKEAAIIAKQITDFIIPESPVIDNSELKQKKESLYKDLNEINVQLTSQAQIKKINARIEELKLEEETQSQELADLERMEFTIAEFSKAKIETIESRINGKFAIVKFKMFEQQINGGETEACECMVDGVPYSDVNTAGKIMAGIDIINALTEHYKINAPVFIDNRESIVRIPDCKSQIINLIVKEGAKLTVKVAQELAVESN